MRRKDRPGQEISWPARVAVTRRWQHRPDARADAVLGVPAGARRRPRPARARAGRRPGRRRPRGHRASPGTPTAHRCEEYADGVRIVRAAEDPVSLPARHRLPAGLDDGVQPHPDPGRAARRRPARTTSSTPTTGWSRTPPSTLERAPRTCRWSPPSTPPRRAGTRAGCRTEMNRTIHAVEWWLTARPRRVIACSAYMRWEVTRLFELPAGTGRRGAQRRRRPGRWRARPRAVASARGPVRRPTARWSGTPGGWSTRRACSTCVARRAPAAATASRAAGGDRRRRPVPGRAGGAGPGAPAGSDGRLHRVPADADLRRAARRHRRDGGAQPLRAVRHGGPGGGAPPVRRWRWPAPAGWPRSSSRA